MKQYTIYIVGLFALCVSCKEEPKPKVKYDAPTKVEVKKDTTTIEVSDLPIQFEGATNLIFPIGELRVSDLKKGSYESDKYTNATFNVSNILEDEITGYLRNLKFQEKDSDSLHVLTDKMVLIERVTFLKSKKLLVYVLADADTNQDTKVDSDDIKSLYLSTDLGKNFTKISPDVHELVDWNIIENTNRIYFRTIDDTNKNGAFDKKDNLHYFSINLAKDWKVEEFSPVK